MTAAEAEPSAALRENGHENGEENGEQIEDIDERRLNRRAYDYLCRLLEVRTWLQECLREPDGSDLIPPVTELETVLSNGVLLARLGNSFAPEIVPAGKIFDADQSRYRQSQQCSYRHTDNIMLWRRAMESVRLPEVFIPETVDVYEGRNMKTIFCLYALAFHLYRMRKAPPIRNQAGNAVFSNDDMAVMKEHLKDSKMPEFGDVGGILSDKRMSSDEAAAAEAIRAIATAISNKDAPALLSALRSHDAGILYVEPALSEEYLNAFIAHPEGFDLNKTSVQNTVIEANNSWASRHLDGLLLGAQDGTIDRSSLYAVFDALQIEDTREKAFELYVRILQERRAVKGRELTAEEIRHIVDEANTLVEVKVAAEHGSSLDSFAALSAGILNLDVDDDNAKLYHDRLQSTYRGKEHGFFLLRDDLAAIVREFSTLSESERKYLELRSAVAKRDTEIVATLLQELLQSDFKPENTDFYLRTLENAKEGDYTEAKLAALLRSVNEECARELRTANLVIDLNKALTVREEAQVERKIHEVGPVLLPDSFRHNLLDNYVEKLLQSKLPPPPGGEEVENGNSTVEWFRHDFRLAAIWVETQERTWRTRKQSPEVDGYLNVEEIKYLLEEENEAYDSAIADEKERAKMEEAAKLIQDNYRKYLFRKDAQELKSADAPSLRLVRKFVTYLQDKDYDVSEELDIEKSKARVTQLVVANQRLDRDLSELDEKIGLLIKNRINLQDVIADKNKISEEAARLGQKETSFRRKDRQQTEALEQLFYHLQTDTAYMANHLEGSKSLDSSISSILAPTFGFLTERREEFLVVRVLCELVTRSVNEIAKPDDLAYSRRAPLIAAVLNNCVFDSLNDRVCDVLTDELKDFFATEKKEHQTFNLDPLDIYASMYPGTKTNDAQTALEDENVKGVLEESKNFLATWSESFTKAVLEKHRLPKSVLYLLSFAADELMKKFPAIPPADQHKAIAELAYEIWICPSLMNSRHLSASTGKDTTEDGMHKMAAVTKFMQFAVANRGYGNAKWYLSSLNKQIHIINMQFRQYVFNALSSISYIADLYCGLSEYTHYDAARRPVLALHGKNIREVVETMNKQVGNESPKSFRTLLTNVAAFAPSIEEDRTLVLYLHPLPSYGSYDDEEKVEKARHVQEVFVKTKKYVVDLLLSGCVGSTLPELLDLKASPGVEETHRRLFNNSEPKFENIAAKQNEIRTLLDELELAKRVDSDDGYQEIVTDIANDIRLATARRKERSAQRMCLEDSEKRLSKQREELKDRLSQYEKYLDTCLENLSKTSKYLSFRPNTEKAGKITKARSSTAESTKASHKSSVEKLFRKGVLVDNRIAGSDNTRKAAKWQVEFIRSDKKGVFEVRVLDGKDPLGEYTIDFQDLLQAQYRNEKEYNLKNSLVFSIGELIAHINKKFYGT